MANAHCVCPKFLQDNIRNSTVYTDVFIGQLLHSDDQIVLDREEILVSAYLNAVKEDPEAFQNFMIWKKLLDSRPQGKMLLSNSGEASTSVEVVYNTISQAITRHDKVIIAADNNHYAALFSLIEKGGINLLNLNSFQARPIAIPNKKLIGFSKFENDLDWVLERIGRTCRKSYSEDDDNDHVRDLLDAKGYSIKDQTREGRSATGLSAGELDLAVMNCGSLYTIIEAMKLSTMRESYIDEHYRKLITNYNPLSVKRTYLVTYYTGKNFHDWWRKYKDYITTMDIKKVTDKEKSSNDSTEEQETDLHGLKKLHNHITVEGEHSVCAHYAVRIDN
ncbi:hypothetical protein K9857_04420 [Pseudomonas sp. REP124]|uniref:hypothetical protein n=1 Tax=Pseudomonas sp. REP124 TaxID=2875731 RepID=UPI001CCA249E|nr:hypothetical protein [Pseudomonas sp. REP124]MBZ9780797.1 hypothetical protein [Pseudomonas sp. REP124]